MLSMLTTSIGIVALGAAALASEVDGKLEGGSAPVRDGSTYGDVSSCAYQYGRWQATHTACWRDMYYVCASVSDAADEGFD